MPPSPANMLRPVDAFNFYKDVPKDHTFCIKTLRMRDGKGRFVKPSKELIKRVNNLIYLSRKR